MKQSRKLRAWIVTLFALVSAVSVTYGQLEGTPVAGNASAAYFYISKPGEVTMSVNLWGMVKFPGRYEVPISTDLIQLISYAGGPLPEADLGAVLIDRVERRSDSIRKVDFVLDLKNLAKLEGQALALRPSDTIFVDRLGFTTENFFAIVTTVAVVVTAVASLISVSQ